jgi:hypothetical protein
MYPGADGNPLFFVAGDNSAFVPASGFYSTGIYNKHGYRIANLVQNSSGDPIISQSEIAIVPDPGDCSRYYIFGSAEDYSLGGGKYYPFYTYIDMDEQTPSPAPVNETGKLIQPANLSGGNIKNMYDTDLTPNSGYISQQRPYLTGLSIAVTKPRSGDGNSRLVYIYNGYYFYVYKVTTTGVQYVAMYNLQASLTVSTYGSDILHPAEMELYEDVGSGKIRVAVPLADGAFSNREEIGLFEFSLSTGAYIGSSYRIFCISDECSGLSSSSNPDVTGLEFSPDGNYLYFTHTPTLAHPNPVEWLEYSNLSNWGGLTPSSITMTNYQYSQIEVGLDGKLYLPASNRISTMSSPNSPTSYTWANFAITQTIPLYNNAYFMPDQVDQETYGGFYTATPECCRLYATFNVDKKFIMPTGTYTVGPTFPQVVNGTDSQGNAMAVTFGATTTTDADIIVPAGATVTFSSVTIQFTKGTGLIVDAGGVGAQGGKVRLNGSTLTWYNGCSEDEFWNGVLLHGNDLVPQGTTTSSRNAVLTCIAASQIDHALTGITIEHGAIAAYTNSRLYDNKVAVEATQYLPTIPVTPDQSRFTGCTIKTQSSYVTGWGQPGYFVNVVSRQPAMRFINCTITNEATAFNYAYDGIIGNNGALTISDCDISNLRYGVFHVNSGTNYALSLKISDITNCFVGACVGNSNYAAVAGNNFNVLDNSSTWPVGLQLEGSSRFEINTNAFKNASLTTATVSGATTGLLAVNTNLYDSSYINIIEQNTFTKLHIGAANDGKNYTAAGGTPSNDRGLRYYCNTYSSPIAWYDFSIASGTIDNHQGIGTYAAGNQFSHTIGAYDVNVNMGALPALTPASTITYVKSSSVAGSPYWPTVAPAAVAYFTLTTPLTNDNDCSSTAVGSPGGRLLNEEANPELWLEKIAELQTLIEEAQNEEPENEANISWWSGRQDQLKTELVIYYLNDTLHEFAMDSAYKYMLAATDPSNKKQLIGIYLAKNDPGSAQDVYDLLHAEEPGSNADKYYAILLELRGKDIVQELHNNTALYNDVQELANDSSDRSVFTMSRWLLNQLQPNRYRPYYGGVTPPSGGERKAAIALQTESPYKLSNYPNPFNGSTTLNAFVPKGSTSASLMITDVLGKEVAAYKLNEGDNSVVFEKPELSGLLFYTLFIDGVRKETKLMMKTGQ